MDSQNGAFRILDDYREIIILTLCGLLIGVLVGLVMVVFGLGLSAIVSFHEMIGNILLLGLPLGGLFIVFLFQSIGRPAKDGVNLIFEVDQEKREKIPKRLASLMIVSTWITHLFGGSSGREGVAVQVGATLADFISRKLKMPEAKTIFLNAGVAAGFAGLFGIPFTAVFFSLEIFAAGYIKYSSLPCVLAAAFSSCYITSKFGMNKSVLAVEYEYSMNLTLVTKLIVLGILFGLVGQMFAYGMEKTKHFMREKFPNPYKRMGYMSVLLALLLLFWDWGRYSSLSEGLLTACYTDGTIYWYDWIGKMVCTIFTLSIGFTGGEVFPMMTIGSLLGCIIGPAFGVSSAVGAMLGYAAVFGAGTNTYFASIMVGMEIFGYQYFPLFFIVCSVAYIINRNQSIYALQRIIS
jgi:H+/Cl- antiporter ClcA